MLVAASATTLLTAGVAHAELARDDQAHRACLDRFESVSQREMLPLKAGDTYAAPQPAAGQYHYYFNATERGGDREYRVECEARQIGKVTYFALEPGRWRFEQPETEGYAAR